MSPTEWILLQAFACVGLAIVTQKVLEIEYYVRLLLRYRPFSCGFCLTFWWSILLNEWIYRGAAGGYDLVAVGAACLVGMLAVGLAPWAFYSTR